MPLVHMRDAELVRTREHKGRVVAVGAPAVADKGHVQNAVCHGIPFSPYARTPGFQNTAVGRAALFGALGYQYFSKSLKLTAIPLAFMTLLCVIIPSMVDSTSFLIIACGGIAIAAGFVFYKKGWIKEAK